MQNKNIAKKYEELKKSTANEKDELKVKLQNLEERLIQISQQNEEALE